jgi:Enoyl-(Acyl carrier protein) reductase
VGTDFVQDDNVTCCRKVLFCIRARLYSGRKQKQKRLGFKPLLVVDPSRIFPQAVWSLRASFSPGVIRTPFHDSLSPEAAANNIKNRIPLRREGKPADVADLITCLIENDFITGENMVIDGGMTMRIV